MKKTFVLLAAALIALTAAAQRQAAPSPVRASDYQFTTVKELPITSMKNQANSGTCWCFSAISFLESEIIKAKNLKADAYPDLSEMFVVRHSYHDRALKYVRLNGFLNMAQGSGFGDVLEVIRDYGIMPQKDYTGMHYGTELPAQGELDAVLKGYVQAVVKNPNRKLTPVWTKGFDGILDAYLGEVPETFVENGVTYTPQSRLREHLLLHAPSLLFPVRHRSGRQLALGSLLQPAARRVHGRHRQCHQQRLHRGLGR